MTLLTIDGIKVGIEHMPVTRRNEHVLREYYERTQEFLQAHVQSEWKERVGRAIAKCPDLLMYLTSDGEYNESELRRIAEGIQYRYREDNEGAELPMNDAMEQAAKRLLANYQTFLTTVPELARVLYFSIEDWPETKAGLEAGIGIIIGTADVESMPEELRKRWETIVPSSDVWMDTTAREVAEYINNFRKGYGVGNV